VFYLFTKAQLIFGGYWVDS